MTEPHEETDGPPAPSDPDADVSTPVPPSSGATSDEASIGEPATPVEAPTQEPATPVEAPTQEPATPAEVPTEEAATPAEAPAAPSPESAPAGSGTQPTTLWAPPEGSKSGGARRGCVIVALVGALLVLGFLVYLIFLGARLAERAGTIEFGTGGTGCAVTGTATTFPASAAIRSVAYLEHDVAAGTTITTTATLADGTATSSDETFDQAATCVTQAIDPGLPPGHYNLEYRLGTEVLATGGFDITP